MEASSSNAGSHGNNSKCCPISMRRYSSNMVENTSGVCRHRIFEHCLSIGWNVPFRENRR